MLAIDPKTLRQWLQQANMPLQAHPIDARLKCLTAEQVWQLARVHARPIHHNASAEPARAEPSQEVRLGKDGTPLSPALLQEADLVEKVAHLETEVATMQHHLTQLAIALLQERERRYAGRLQALEVLLHPTGNPPLSPAGLQATAAQCQQDADTHHERGCHPTERRARACPIPLIEYGAAGSYVLICPKAGELHILPDSPEWFEWLASLSSFRFVGKSGRFGARRGYNRGPNRGWYAQRTIHQRNYSRYLGVSENLTITRLELIAANLQSYADWR